MKLFIKNMVCPRCIMSVEKILKDNEINVKYVRLGEVELEKEISDKQMKSLSGDLLKVGFEILEDSQSQLIEKVKTIVTQKVQQAEIESHFSVNRQLTKQIFKDYSSISKLFSEVEGITIERYFILQKIEKVKEYLVYKELSLSDIAYKLGYSSTQHLSSQFKKITGITPTQFRNNGDFNRKAIDKIAG